MRIALYLRVSTEEQTVENQLPDLLELAKRIGAANLRALEVERFVDQVSGKNIAARPELNRFLGELRRFDALLVWSLDRLGRNSLEVLNLLEQLRAAGVRVVSYREPWLDTAGPTAQLLTMILTWVAEFERRRLVERTHAGIARARAQGKRIGRPPVAVTPERALYLHELNEGASGRTARQLNISEDTLTRLLKKARQSSQAARGAAKPGGAGDSEPG